MLLLGDGDGFEGVGCMILYIEARMSAKKIGGKGNMYALAKPLVKS